MNLGESSFRKKFSIFVKDRGAIRHFVTPNFVQAAFGSKNLDKRLKFCIQPPIVTIWPDLNENLTSIKNLGLPKNRKRLSPDAML